MIDASINKVIFIFQSVSVLFQLYKTTNSTPGKEYVYFYSKLFELYKKSLQKDDHRIKIGCLILIKIRQTITNMVLAVLR